MRYQTLLILIVFLAGMLRIAWLGSIPNSLYTDEINQGYNAYSILKTGKDEHGVLFPISIRSFGDWKPPLTTYLMIPTIYLFGLSEFAVRLPSAVLGIGSIVLIFYLTLILFENHPSKYRLALISSMVLAISPWHILQNRSAMLVITALFFFMAGIYFFLKSRNKSIYSIPTAISFALTLYSYYGLRITTPLMVLYLFIIYRKHIPWRSKHIIFGLTVGIILVVPLFFSFLKQPDVIFGRVKTISIFYDKGINLWKWELITQDGLSANVYITRFFHNNVFFYGRDILRHFLSHLDGRYLFLTGDNVPPFQISGMGIFYLFDGIFMILGSWYLYKSKSSVKYLLLFWFFVGILPSALTFITPASNRSFMAIVPFVLLISFGLAYFRYRFLFAGLISILYIFSFAYFLQQYFIVMPLHHADWWSYQLKKAAQYSLKSEKKYDRVIYLNNYSMSYVYLLFYSHYDPARFQKEAIWSNVTDRSGFEHVERFGKYIFYDDLKWADIKDSHLPKTLYIIPASQSESERGYMDHLTYPDGEEVYKIFGYE